jgi:hypothetical protein
MVLRSRLVMEPSVIVLTPYTLWVVGYDVPWTYRLWRLNPGQPADST